MNYIESLPPQRQRIIGRDERHPTLDGIEVVPMEDETFFMFPLIKLGKLSEGRIPERYCAGYAKTVAFDSFGKEYVRGEEIGAAWNLRYSHKTIPIEEDNILRDLERKFEGKILTPGDLLGIYYPPSELNETQKDIYGLKISYSHCEVFIGRDILGDLRTGGQVVTERRTITIEEMLKQGMIPRVIIKSELKPRA